MPVIAAILVAGICGAFLTVRWKKGFVAWLIGSMIVPITILILEFVLPYQGGGASMWPIAMVIGGGLGSLSSALGVFLASFTISDGDRA